MNDRKYHFLLVLISLVVLATLAIQVYLNYINLKDSEDQLVVELQNSLDESVDTYYALLAKDNNIGIMVKKTTNKHPYIKDMFERFDTDTLSRSLGYNGFKFDDIPLDDISEIFLYNGANMSTLNEIEPVKDLWNLPNYEINAQPDNNFALEIQTFFADTQNLQKAVAELNSKMILSIKEESMNLERLDSLVNSNLDRKKIHVNFDLMLIKKRQVDSLFPLQKNNALRASSELLPRNQALTLTYSSLSKTIFKLNITGILLSALLIAAVVLCLFYLLQIIKKQKALGEMKNDLISNITHEFKTPIATASAALEGVQSFNNSGDLDKTDRYLSMGRDQLVKLNGMVERILETATLDSKDLMLQKSAFEINELIDIIIKKHQNQTSKKITFKEIDKNITITADAFHLENAINNLVDNAIKYGGDQITVELKNNNNYTVITVSDNGQNLSNKDVKLIFDKFYRVGKGNRHDVKGFGIGLFYTKSIIEKHNGTITAAAQPQTTFKITMPHE
ncbi:HAMP domain-containing sensor histidine kinase [uncultured Nonlabens sp.]|uniref:sensor histidine kinase n=1 Tax=uncultured Nonlabens sp. TaxID=859306 RepID=UPI00262F391C|nr:HAMP domain-containing sensor histidine kinase [uncultured Nonlabens sp.]